MVVEHAYLAVHPGRESEFEQAFEVAVPILTSAAGCVGAKLFRDSEVRGRYLLQVRWHRLEDHLEVFPTSAAGVTFADQVAHFFAATPEVRHFDDAPVGE